MKIFIKFILLSAAVISLFIASSCSSCSNKKEHHASFKELSQATHEDTLRAFNMTKEFMDKLKKQDIDGALNMLKYYDIAKDSMEEISKGLRNQYYGQFKAMPVIDYEIKTSKFMNHTMGIVTYRYRFMDNPTTDPNYPCTTNITLAVRHYAGEYKMYLYDHTIIKK